MAFPFLAKNGPLRAAWPAAAALLLAALAFNFWPHQLAPPQRPVGVAACGLPAPASGSPHPGMVWVPKGAVDLGDTVYDEEKPLGTVQVDGFWMDRTEVTNDQFARFVAATGYVTVAERPVDTTLHADLPPLMRQSGAVVFQMPAELHGRDDASQWWRYIPGASWRHPGGPDTSIDGRGAYPVVAVTIEDARAYATWQGRALPTEAQWEWAARAAKARARDEHEQPKSANTWQGLFPLVNSADDGFIGLAPVACYAPNALGLYDMIGNVWELTADVYHASHAAPAPDQMAPMHGTASAHVIKGGSFLCAPNYCMRYRAGARQPQEDDLATSHLGFRTILIAPGP